MRDALRKDRRIHRDLSLGNVVLVKEPDSPIRRGYLVDWESSCRVDEEGKAVEPGRTVSSFRSQWPKDAHLLQGTWRYMSIRTLDPIHGLERPLTLQDDMESLLYVVLYCALMWQPHNLPRRTLTELIRTLFDECIYVPPRPAYGGQAKRENARSRVYTDHVQFESQHLHNWLDTMMNYHSPLQHHGEEFRNRWSDPAFIETFWANFLAAHPDLEPANRVENKPYPPDIYEDPVSPSPSHRSSPQPTGAGTSRKRKRGREPSKIPPLEPARSSSHQSSGPSPRLRRSKRPKAAVV